LLQAIQKQHQGGLEHILIPQGVTLDLSPSCAYLHIRRSTASTFLGLQLPCWRCPLNGWCCAGPLRRSFSKVFIISLIIKFAAPKVTSLWSTVQQKIPKNIVNFSSKYLTNTLATHKNLFKWSIGQSSACSFYLQSETLQHIVSICKSYLNQGRYTWGHDSVLNFIANTLLALPSCSI